MSWFDWMRMGGAAARASGRAARAGAEGISTLSAGRGARRGVLGPGDPPPPAAAPTDYLDYRGTARLRELGALRGGEMPLGRLIDVRRGRPGQPVGLSLGDAGAHTLVVGPTRAGKTASVIVPWVLAALRQEMTVVAVDVKGDLWDDLLAHAASSAEGSGGGWRAARWDYRHPGEAISWNWIAELAGERAVHAASEALLGRERPGDPQPYFHQRDLRMMAAVLTVAAADRGRDWTAADLLAVIADQGALAGLVRGAADPGVAVALSDAIGADPVDYPRVVSGLMNALQPLASTAVDAVTRERQLALDDLLSHPGLLVCGAPLGDGRLSVATSSLLLAQLTQRVYERMASGVGSRLLLVVDEAARVADRLAFEELLAVSAGAGCTVLIAVQDLGQFQNEHERSAVVANCGNLLALPGCSPLSAEAFSRRLGERPEVESSEDHGGGRRGSRRHAMVPVLRAREIMQPPFGPRTAVVHARGASPKPFLTDLTRSDLG